MELKCGETKCTMSLNDPLREWNIYAPNDNGYYLCEEVIYIRETCTNVLKVCKNYEEIERFFESLDARHSHVLMKAFLTINTNPL
jgi:hypothetical protein